MLYVTRGFGGNPLILIGDMSGNAARRGPVFGSAGLPERGHGKAQGHGIRVTVLDTPDGINMTNLRRASGLYADVDDGTGLP